MKILHPALVLNRVVEEIMWDKFLFDGRMFKKNMGVGQYYQQLPEEQKEALKRLTSTDASNIREEYIKMMV